MQIHSKNIKAVLIYYYRFKRQFIAVDEVHTDCYELADVLVSTKKYIIEIEIKTAKSDLNYNESKKQKHKKLNSDRYVNKFYLCVPTELIEDAKIWIEKTNPNYGLIEFVTEKANKPRYVKYEYCLHFNKDAKLLQPKYYEGLKEKLIKRLCSALANEYIANISRS